MSEDKPITAKIAKSIQTTDTPQATKIAAHSSKNDCALLVKKRLYAAWKNIGAALAAPIQHLPYMRQAAHIRAQYLRHFDATVRLLVILQHSHQGTAYR